MPQLPSGRLVAISPEPLNDLLKEAAHFGNIHKVMALRTANDLERYVEVVFLVPEAEAGGGQTDVEFRSDSLPCPRGCVQVPSGYRLSQWDQLTADWPEEDKTAMRAFLDGRAVPLFQDGLGQVQRVQDALRGDGDFLTRALVGWWDAGCHPAQEEGWEASDVGTPDWDDYDMLAALGQVWASLPQRREFAGKQQVAARLAAFWNLCKAELSPLTNWLATDTPVRDCASEARNQNWLALLDEQKRHWLHDQAVAECVGLWNIVGEGFPAAFPQPYGIIELVVVSREADKYFEIAPSDKEDHDE